MAKNPKRAGVTGTTGGRQTAALEDTHHRGARNADNPVINIRDLVMDDIRSAGRLAQYSGLTASELKAEIDRGFKSGWVE